VKASVFRGGGRLRLEEWPMPAIAEGELLLQMRGCGVCGSDIAKIIAPATAAPAVFGHEVVGDVVAAGAAAPFAVGERVVAAHHVPCGDCHYCHRGSPSMCRAFKSSNLDPGGFAEFVRVPAVNARHATFRVPPTVNDEAAAFVEPLACCLRATRRAPVTTGDTVVVVGLGSIGCLFVRLLRRAGARVIGADPLVERADLARRLGAAVAGDADVAAAAARDLSEGRGADQVIVTGGGAAVLAWAPAVVRDGATVHYFSGGGGESLPLPLNTLYARELTVMSTYSASPAQLAEAFELIVSGVVSVAALVTHRLPLARLAEGVELMRRREALKVYVTP
jgi:L-iditol 2-dehydrogenase